MDTKELRSRLQDIPQLRLINVPSPLEPLPRLYAQIKTRHGPKIWIKRDDELGPGLGGNKGRKLTYIMADVLTQKKRKVVTFGGLQSNHVCMTAAACAKLGLEAHLFFFNPRPSELTGNLLLNQILGAKMHFIPFGSGPSKSLTLEATNRLVRLVSIAFTGRSSYFMPVGGHSTTGCYGYVEAACEIYEQILELGLAPAQTTIVTAAGTGGTLAGLIAGLALLGSPLHVLGIDIGKLWKGFPESIARLATSLCANLGSKVEFSASDIPLIENTYAGQAYAQPTTQGTQASQLIAQTEGILLDPVYTGKAFAGMLDLIDQKKFDPNENLIFLHTGGIPALWA